MKLLMRVAVFLILLGMWVPFSAHSQIKKSDFCFRACGDSFVRTSSSGSRGSKGFGFSSSFQFTSSTTTDARRLTSLKDYVNYEIVTIQEEAAQGGGAHLDALASLLNEADGESFSLWMKSHYQVIFVDLDHPEELLTRVRSYRSIYNDSETKNYRLPLQ